MRLTGEAIAGATAFDARNINRNCNYDGEAHHEMQHNLQHLIELRRLRPAMELSLELMDKSRKSPDPAVHPAVGHWTIRRTRSPAGSRAQ